MDRSFQAQQLMFLLAMLPQCCKVDSGGGSVADVLLQWKYFLHRLTDPPTDLVLPSSSLRGSHYSRCSEAFGRMYCNLCDSSACLLYLCFGASEILCKILQGSHALIHQYHCLPKAFSQTPSTNSVNDRDYTVGKETGHEINRILALACPLYPRAWTINILNLPSIREIA